MSLRLLLLLALMGAGPVCADSFRCGSRLISNGDSVARLLKVCGKPALKYRARDKVGRSGRSQSVQQWVYERGRKRAMVVSVLDGKVVRISRE